MFHTETMDEDFERDAEMERLFSITDPVELLKELRDGEIVKSDVKPDPHASGVYLVAFKLADGYKGAAIVYTGASEVANEIGSADFEEFEYEEAHQKYGVTV